MQNLFRRFIASVMALVMTATLLPAQAFAWVGSDPPSEVILPIAGNLDEELFSSSVFTNGPTVIYASSNSLSAQLPKLVMPEDVTTRASAARIQALDGDGTVVAQTSGVSISQSSSSGYYVSGTTLFFFEPLATGNYPLKLIYGNVETVQSIDLNYTLQVVDAPVITYGYLSGSPVESSPVKLQLRVSGYQNDPNAYGFSLLDMAGEQEAISCIAQHIETSSQAYDMAELTYMLTPEKSLMAGSTYALQVSPKNGTLYSSASPIGFTYSGYDPGIAILEATPNEEVAGGLNIRVGGVKQGGQYAITVSDGTTLYSDAATPVITSGQEGNGTFSVVLKKNGIVLPLSAYGSNNIIITVEDWEAVQKINQLASLRSVGRQKPTTKLFTGKLVCADCKGPLNANTETQRRRNGTSKKYVSYFCGTFGKSGRSVCSWHRIYEKTLVQLVTAEIKTQAQAVTLDETAVVDKLKRRITDYDEQRLTATKQEIAQLRRRVRELEAMTTKLYEDKYRGAVSENAFMVLVQKNEQERLVKAERLDALLSEVDKAEKETAAIQNWAAIIRKYLDLDVLDRTVIDELIDHIEIGERTVVDGQRRQDIKVFYKFVGLVT